jgi:hypothetical protein
MLICTLKSKNLGTPSSGEHMMKVRKEGRKEGLRIDMFGFKN